MFWGIAAPAVMVSLVALKTTLVAAQLESSMQCPAVAMMLGPISVPAREGQHVSSKDKADGWARTNPAHRQDTMI